jgi:hypothetical protein
MGFFGRIALIISVERVFAIGLGYGERDDAHTLATFTGRCCWN